ncbi:nuclear pore complex protein Nup153 [Lingula anatina]|uniref:Nuclear pore complex protein Nup153 n=1 Tax=Lingula anatina TaxID=7574 RepID=A0A1S3H1J9_LINAN|nr:nuclear pore complex protein Nup153 [Lingula anatina]|eukprot:XP_013380005.1 nuclear pore complex protein Nup153 [Lingula anatina]
MSNAGGGKVRQTRRKPSTDKPYNRRQSLLSRVTDTVKDILSPSWLVDIVSSVKKKTSPQLDTVEEHNDNGEDLEESYLPPRAKPQMPPHMQSKAHPSQPSYQSSSVLTERPLYGGSSLGRTPFSSFKPDLHTSTPGTSGGHIPFPVYKGQGEDHRRGLSHVSSLIPEADKPDFKSEMLQLQEAQLQQLREDLGGSVAVREEMSSTAVEKSLDMSQSLSGSHLWSTSEVSKPQPSVRTHRPSFNASIFGSPATNTSLFGGQSSPYYPGRTTFGGATSHRKNRLNSTAPYQTAAPLRRQVKAKPLNNTSTGVTSSTAKKILETLERMSTPLNDAKKIPASSLSIADSPLSFTPASYRQRRNQQNHSLTSRSQLKAPPVMKLNTPSAASIAKNRQTFPQPPPPETAPKIQEKPGTSTEYKVGSTDQQPALSKSSGKMKRERAGHYSRQGEDEEQVVLPDLPTSFKLQVSSMPKFDFMGSTGNTVNSADKGPPVQANGSIASSPTPGFAFSNPIPQSSSEAHQGSLSPVKQDFKFSSPIAIGESSKTTGAPTSSSVATAIQFTSTSTATAASTVLNKDSNSVQFNFGSAAPSSKGAPQTTFGFGSGPSSQSSVPPAGGMQMKFTASPVAPKPKPKANKSEPEEDGFAFKPAKELKSGSVMDILGKGTTTTTTDAKSSPGTGIAPASSLKQGSVMDILGKAPEVSQSSNTLVGFGDKFKPAAGSWECDSCMVRNKASDSKCAACQSAKPGSSTTTSVSSAPATNTVSSWGSLADKFKAAPGAWECSTCLVRNKDSATGCAACGTVKPGLPTNSSTTTTPSSKTDTCSSVPPIKNSLGSLFKKPEGSWECGTCMVMNKPDASSCVACQTPNPNGAKTPSVKEPEIPKPTGPPLSSIFKKSTGSWECDLCMVQNKPEAVKCAACEAPKPGLQPTAGFTGSGMKGGFKFGTGSGFQFDKTTSGDNKTSGFTFGTQTTSTATSNATGFKFGVQEVGNTGDIKFGFQDKTVGTGIKFGTGADKQSEEKKEQKSSGGFKFGGDSVNTSTSNTAAFGGFKFGQTNDKSVDSKKEQSGAETSVPGGFKFGANPPGTTTTTATMGGFSFGSKPGESTQSVSNAVTSAAGGFSFGAPKPSVNSTDLTANPFPATSVPSSGFAVGAGIGKGDTTKPTSSGFSFGNTDTSGAAAFTFGAKPDETKSTGNITFGQTAPSSGGFGAKEKSSPLKRGHEDEDEISGKKLAFGSIKPTGAVAPTISFPAASVTQAPALGGFTASTTTSTTSATSAPSLFGSTVAFGSGGNTSVTSSAPLPLFGSSSTAPSSLFSTPSTTPSFGTQGAPSSGFGTTAPVFGAGAPSTFGASTATTSASTTGSVFGSSTPAFSGFGGTFGSTQAFGSGGAGSDSTKNTGAPVFASGFGSTGPGATGTGPAPFSTTPSFQFGQTTAPGASTGTGEIFAFGAKPQESKPADGSSGSTFGSGSSAGFNFSATPNTNFGASQATSFSATPSFNFSGSQAQFSGFGATGPTPDNPFSANSNVTRGRTIKRAARRLKKS